MIKKIGFKKLINDIGNIAFFVLFIAILVLSYQSVKLKTNSEYIPRIFGQTYLNVLSGSMSPEFNPNDLILGRKIENANSLSTGDIITFKDGNMLVTHRIVEIVEPGKKFVTKGDANKVEDQRVVEESNIISKYYITIPKAGYVVAKFQDYTFLGFCWLIIMYMIISELIKEFKVLKKKTKENIKDNVEFAEEILK